MCFIPNDLLLFSTDRNNYSVNLNDDELFNKQTDKDTNKMETNDDDIVAFLTSAKTDQKFELLYLLFKNAKNNKLFNFIKKAEFNRRKSYCLW